MTSKERAKLRSLASTMQPIFQVGKNGNSDTFVRQIDEALEARELIKITVLNNSGEDAKEIASEFANATKSEVVTVIGSKIVLYRKSEKNPIVTQLL